MEITIIGVQLVAIYPSSNAKNLPAEPESLDMNTMVPTGMPLRISSFCATRIGPMVFVFKWLSKASKELDTIKCLWLAKLEERSEREREKMGGIGANTLLWLSIIQIIRK